MKLVPLQQGSDAWRQWRQGGVGGSDLVAVLDLPVPWDDPPTRARLLHEKVTGAERETNFAMRRGTRKEGEARWEYECRTGCVAIATCVEMDGMPWARVSLDGLCSDHRIPQAERVKWVAEIKCPSWTAHELALNGFVPDYYGPQIQWQLLVTGLDRCDYVSWNDGDRFQGDERLAVVAVAADPAEQTRLLEECGRFWHEVLEAREQAKGGAVCRT